MSEERYVLQARIDSLKASLEQVESVIKLVQNRRAEFDVVSQHLADATQRIHEIRPKIGHIKVSLDTLGRAGPEEERELAEALQKLGESREGVEAAENLLRSATQSLESIKARSFDAERSQVSKTLDLEIASQAKTWIKELEDLSTGLRAGDGGASSEQVADAWVTYNRLLQNDTRPLFSEYVDLLRGLALRDTGFDEGICTIADDLIKACADIKMPPWDSLTVPSKEESITSTVARIIRLGFPEWTIWAIPYAAHEFWHIWVSKGTDIESLIGQESEAADPPEHIHTLFADAFATYAMGPAYAYSAIVLRFDPRAANSKSDTHPTSSERAEIIFQMLERVWDGELQVFAGSVSDLREKWDTTLDQANPDDISDHIDEARLKSLKDYSDSVASFLDTNSQLNYPRDSWKQIQTWQNSLASDPFKISRESVDGTEDLRDVLNMAWQCRAVHPNTLPSTIARNARQLWSWILEARTGARRHPPRKPAQSSIDVRGHGNPRV